MKGRKTKYRAAYCADLVDHMSEGLSFESFAGVISVAQSTLHEWAKVHRDFFDAKKIGESKSLLTWEKIGRAGAQGKIKDFNNATYIFNMKNRFGWSDRTDLRLSASLESDSDDLGLLRAVPRQALIELAKNPKI